jgi:hypothetical protein
MAGPVGVSATILTHGKPSQHPAACDIGGPPPRTGLVSALGATDAYADTNHQSSLAANRRQAASATAGGWKATVHRSRSRSIGGLALSASSCRSWALRGELGLGTQAEQHVRCWSDRVPDRVGYPRARRNPGCRPSPSLRMCPPCPRRAAPTSPWRRLPRRLRARRRRGAQLQQACEDYKNGARSSVMQTIRAGSASWCPVDRLSLGWCRDVAYR